MRTVIQSAPITKEAVFERLCKMHEGICIWQKYICEDDHLLFLTYMKELMDEDRFWNAGFSVSFNNDYTKFLKTNL